MFHCTFFIKELPFKKLQAEICPQTVKKNTEIKQAEAQQNLRNKIPDAIKKKQNSHRTVASKQRLNFKNIAVLHLVTKKFYSPSILHLMGACAAIFIHRFVAHVMP